MEAAPGLGNGAELGPAQGAPATQTEVVGAPIRRALAGGGIQLRILDTAHQRADDASEHTVLHLEQLASSAVETLCPQLRSRRRLDQPDGDPKPLAQRPDAAVSDIGRPKLAADLLRREFRPAVGEGARRCDDEKLAESSELRRDVLGQAVAEVGERSVALGPGERQDHQ
jgi:hypothetical protein